MPIVARAVATVQAALGASRVLELEGADQGVHEFGLVLTRVADEHIMHRSTSPPGG